MKTPVIAMMMAMDKNKLIGRAGGMPWHIPGEMTYFKQVTMGKPVIMGRKTFESMGKPLPGRTNIVLTRDDGWSAAGVLRATGLDDAIQQAEHCEGADEAIMIIGGAALCRDAMPITQRLYLTVIDHAYEGDTWLDSFDWNDWRKVSEEVRDPSTTGGVDVTYWVLEKH